MKKKNKHRLEKRSVYKKNQTPLGIVYSVLYNRYVYMFTLRYTRMCTYVLCRRADASMSVSGSVAGDGNEKTKITTKKKKHETKNRLQW